jgi:hypothetical protein
MTNVGKAIRRVSAPVTFAACAVVALVAVGAARAQSTSRLSAFADLELPSVHPTPADLSDLIGQEWRAARITYEQTTKHAREALLEQFAKARKKVADGEYSEPVPPPKTAEMKKKKAPKAVTRKGAAKAVKAAPAPAPPIPNVKEQNLQQLTREQRQFELTGIVPTHALLAEAAAAYGKEVDAAVASYQAVLENALAAYEAAGIKEAAKLKPLQGQLAWLKNSDLVGAWSTSATPSPDNIRRQAWLVNYDPATGTWQVDYIDRDSVSTYAVYHGEKVELKGTTLSFVATPVDLSSGKLATKGTSTIIRLNNKRLQGPSVINGKFRSGETFERSFDPQIAKHVAFYLKKGGIGARKGDGSSPTAAPEKLDVSDLNAVWRELAAMSSCSYYRSDGSGPFWGERLYIPFRSSNLTVSPGQFGFLLDTVTGQASGSGVNQELCNDLLRRYDEIAETKNPYLRRAAERAQTLFRARCQLALADEKFGNTPASSIRNFTQSVVFPAVKYAFQREADRASLEDELSRQYPGYRVIVTDSPLSEASRQHLGDMLSGVGRMQDDIHQATIVSGLLGYADMAEADRQVHFWESVLLPLAQRCGGPATTKELVDVEGGWRVRPGTDSFQRLHRFQLQNVFDQDLTHVVIELVAEDRWAGKASHYLYLPRLNVAESVNVMPHPRWDKRKLDFTNKMTVTVSVWADQASSVNRKTELASPAPNPDPTGWRRDYLAFDEKYMSEGEALGAAVQGLGLLRFNAQRQRRLLAAAAAPGSSYIFRLAEDGKPSRTLVLRFLMAADDGSSVEAEIFDAATKKPLRPDILTWKGTLIADHETGYSFRLNADWMFQISAGDQPVIAVPVEKREEERATQQIALLPVKI